MKHFGLYALFSLSLLGAVPLAACSRSAPIAVDEPVMAYLSRARAAHTEADLAEDEGDRGKACGALESLLAAPIPHAGTPIPEVEEVLADANARLADLAIQQKDFSRANRAIDEGLKHVPGSGYYRGHLFEVRGTLKSAEGKAAEASGRMDDAKRFREEARAALKEAVRLQEAVIVGDAGVR